MIVDSFENLNLYFNEESRLYKAICFARDFDPSKADGKYEIEGKAIHAQCNSYTTRSFEEAKFENHKKYIDVQVMINGEEMMGYTFNEGLAASTEYDEEKDVKKFNHPPIYSQIHMKPGYFVVFFPQDLHMPNCMVEKAENVRKLVVKVSV